MLFLWLYIDLFSHIHQAYFTGTVATNDCPGASKATLMNMDKYFMWIHYERLHNHNKAKHNKTVCIFLGIYCNCTYKHFIISIHRGRVKNNGFTPVTLQTIIWINTCFWFIELGLIISWKKLGLIVSWNLNENTTISIPENYFRDVICKSITILYRLQLSNVLYISDDPPLLALP